MLSRVVFSAQDFTLKITMLVQPTTGLFIPPKFLNFQFYLDYLIHSRIKSKNYQYVFTLSALDVRVYILAYDFNLHSVLVHLKCFPYKRMILFFNSIVSVYDITSHTSLTHCFRASSKLE